MAKTVWAVQQVQVELAKAPDREGKGMKVNDDAEQAAIRKRAAPAIGPARGKDPTRSSRARALVREIIRKRTKVSRGPQPTD